jgi:hypothetical protein
MTPSKRDASAVALCVFGVFGFFHATACGPIRSTTTPLDVADQAPPFSLSNQAGQQVTLDELSDRGPAVLVFNRGHR